MAMALVVSDDIDREGRRIVASSSAFEVLELNPLSCQREQILRQYEAKSKLFKGLYKNSIAVHAMSKLDNAKMRLLDPFLHKREVALYNTIELQLINDYEELQKVENRTRLLEERAAALQAPASQP